VEPWSYGKFPYARTWNEGFALDVDHPKGIYRATRSPDKRGRPHGHSGGPRPSWRNPRAVRRPAQATLLYHEARLIEEVYACERAIEIWKTRLFTDTNVRAKVEPNAGAGSAASKPRAGP